MTPSLHSYIANNNNEKSSIYEDPEFAVEDNPTIWQRVKKFLAYCGPGYMIAVGYMDPGNWATDIEAGSKYGYSLLYVILVSNLMAMVLQHLCIRMGVYTRRDLAQNCRIRCGKWTNIFLYVIAELAIISCDLSEVIGTAIALNLLFGLPIFYGVLVTVADVLLLLAGLSSEDSRQYKILEVFVMVLMSIVGGCFIIELVYVKPVWKEVLLGFVPRSTVIFTDKDVLFSALGIIGATVMPHNLYLHSAIVKYRLPPPLPHFKSDNSDNEDECEAIDGGAESESVVELDDSVDNKVIKPVDHSIQKSAVIRVEAGEVEERSYLRKIKSIIHFNTIDTAVALFLALLINAAILIVSAAAFHSRGRTDVKHIEDASALMREWLGRGSSVVFGLALLAAGQSSTVTGTLAGQIVFEGFLLMRLKPWLRRLITRVVAVLPALFIIWLMGEDSVNQLLLYSQVILSFQLPFAIIPLIIFAFPTGGKVDTFGSGKIRPQIPDEAGRGTCARLLKISAWVIAAIIIALNITFPIISLMEDGDS